MPVGDNESVIMFRYLRVTVLAQELQSLIGRVVKALEAEKPLPETVKNPFA